MAAEEPLIIAGESLLLDRFRDYLENVRRYSPHTARAYFSDACAFRVFLLSQEKDLLDADVSTCRLFLGELAKQGISHRSTKRKVSALRTLYDYLIDQELTKVNPFDLLRTPRAEKRLPDFLTPDQVVSLFARNAERDDPLVLRDQALIELMFATGLRAGETVSLTLANTDVEERIIKTFGKGKRERLVPFSKSAQRTLKAYLTRLRPSLVNQRGDGIDPGYIFLNAKGESLTERGLEYIIERIGRACGFPDLHPHTLRHSFATYLVNRGANLRQVQEFMGHASIGTTAIYSHVGYAQLKRAYDRAMPALNPDEKFKKGMIDIVTSEIPHDGFLPK